MSRTRLIDVDTTETREEENNSAANRTTAAKILLWPYDFFGGMLGFSRMGETPVNANRGQPARPSNAASISDQTPINKPKPPTKSRHKKTRSWSYNDLELLIGKQSKSPEDAPSLFSPHGQSLAVMPLAQPNDETRTRLRRHGDFLRLHPDSSPCIPPTHIPEISFDEIPPAARGDTFMRIVGDSASMAQPAHIPEFLSPEPETPRSKSRYLTLKS